MIKLLFYFFAFIVIIYLIVWLKNKWDKLHPNTKKQIIFLGMNGVFNFLRLKWQIIIIAIWQVLKRLIGRK